MIDFQDARLGPDTYDLVSLLRDSYVDLTGREVDELIAYFLALSGGTGVSPGEFRRRFDLMALQRNLKALGTFGYQTTTRDNPVYIQYIPRTLRYVRMNLERYDRFARLRSLLATYVRGTAIGVASAGLHHEGTKATKALKPAVGTLEMTSWSVVFASCSSSLRERVVVLSTPCGLR